MSKREAEQKSSSSSEQQAAEPGDVPRDVGTGTRLKMEINEWLKMSRDAADREEAEGVEVFTALKESAERGLKQLIQQIQDQRKSREEQARGLIRELELLSHSEDHLHQLFSSQKLDLLTEDEGSVVRAVAQLEEITRKERKKVELKMLQKCAVDLTLDPRTAHPNLCLSEDGKQVHYSDEKKKLPDNPERFSSWFGVLAEQSFSSGRFYFEVQVKEKSWWNLGVVRESINRKEYISPCPEKGFWAVSLRNGNEYKAHSRPAAPLCLQSHPEKVGVFVDYEGGVVSFYDVDAAALIYAFTGCSFTEKLYPYFSPCYADGGENLAPLIICAVN